MALAIPEELKVLIQDDGPSRPILDFVVKAEMVLGDNDMPFFPGYTDHGTRHVEGVLKTMVRLIPPDVWENGLITGPDAAAMVGAAILHDFSMHIRHRGFLELIDPGSRFTPIDWFDERQGDRLPDLPWNEAWESFRAEARHFTVSDWERLLGPKSTGVPRVLVGNHDRSPGDWKGEDELVIGEFLRRHHARLSHEIAVYGFPGADEDGFPGAEEDEFRPLKAHVPAIAGVTGVVARSHNESLRDAVRYLDYRYRGDLRPTGVLAVYLMGLLRIADYLQLEADRAPLLLLRLKSPQSPLSIDEWNKHGAVASLSWDNKNPVVIRVEVLPSHQLRVHLQLQELFEDLQQEFDTTAVILAEVYANESLKRIRLSRQRIETNLNEPSLHKELPYVPVDARLRSAEDLFRLVVGDLYGNEPAIAGRELIQNAADAVRDRDRWDAANGESGGGRKYFAETDIEVELRQVTDETFELRVADRGIGMTPATVVDYYLQAGASLAHAPTEREAADPELAVRWMKAGRFGVGAFAAFLLGPELTVRTRHAGASRGVEFTARIDEDLIELRWAQMPLGTEVRVAFAADALPAIRYDAEASLEARAESFLDGIAEFYVLKTPRVAYTLKLSGQEARPRFAPRPIPSPGSRIPDHWRKIDVKGYDSVMWSIDADVFSDVYGGLPWQLGPVVHNGIRIASPVQPIDGTGYRYLHSGTSAFVVKPPLVVFDSAHRLALALTRYDLGDPILPFEDDLLRSIGRDVTARALIAGPGRHPLSTGSGLSPVYSRHGWAPFLPGLGGETFTDDLLIVWTPHRHADPHGEHLIEEAIAGDLETCGWGELPLRTTIAIPSNLIQPSHWMSVDGDFQGGDVGRGNVEFEDYAAWDLVASCAVEDAQLPPREADKPSAWETDLSLGDFRAHTLTTSMEGAPSHALLRAVAAELARRSGMPALAVSVFRVAARPPNASTAVAEAWRSAIGGLLERDADARERRAEEVLRRHANLRVPANKWRRLLARRNPPV